MSKTLKVSLFLFLCFSGCINPKTNFLFTDQLSEDAQDKLLLQIMPYVAKRPKGVSHQDKFDARFTDYYKSQRTGYNITHFFENLKDGYSYIVLKRPAPSLFGKEIAIAIKYKLNQYDSLVAYEELFWTFKFKPEILEKKSSILFKHWLENGNVDQYLPQNNLEEWVEFPDEKNYFDKNQRIWITKDPDSKQ